MDGAREQKRNKPNWALTSSEGQAWERVLMKFFWKQMFRRQPVSQMVIQRTTEKTHWRIWFSLYFFSNLTHTKTNYGFCTLRVGGLIRPCYAGFSRLSCGQLPLRHDKRKSITLMIIYISGARRIKNYFLTSPQKPSDWLFPSTQWSRRHRSNRRKEGFVAWEIMVFD